MLRRTATLLLGTKPPKGFPTGKTPSGGMPKKKRLGGKFSLKMGKIATNAAAAQQAGTASGRDDAHSETLGGSSRSVASEYDEYMFDAPKRTRRERMEATREARIAEIERQASEEGRGSRLEVSEGDEDDLDLGGMPSSMYHNQTESVVIPESSPLYQNVLLRNDTDLKSRRQLNSWSTISNNKNGQNADKILEDLKRRSGSDHAWSSNEGAYTKDFDDATLASTEEQVQFSQSIYTQRKLYLDGLEGFSRVVTRAEELAISSEVVQLLQKPTAKYIPEEHRYCVNLYERRLGMKHKEDPLAFSLSECPVLEEVLTRFFQLGLIPAPPNIVQVSEMAGDNAGYPPHIKHPSIGSYFGMLTLITHDTLMMKHRSNPWLPKLFVQPRSLYVVTSPALQEYSFGYKMVHKTMQEFRNAVRTTKDYRLEILFATVDAQFVPALSEAVNLTEYDAERRRLRWSSNPQLEEGTVQAENTTNGSAETAAPRPSMNELLKKMEALSAAGGSGKGTEKAQRVEDVQSMLGVLPSDFGER